MDLSGAAKTALVNVGTNRQGAIVHPNTPAGALAELRDAGLIGTAHGYGLTRKGSIARERLMDEKLREAFGA